MNLARALIPFLIVPWVLSCTSGPTAGTGPRIDPALRDELLTLESRDQAARAPGAANRAAIDAANLARFREIVDQRGWPSRDVVGVEATNAAATIALHADADPAFQRRCLELMQTAAGRGEASPLQVAYLTDRVLVNEGKPQMYGTQFTVQDGQPVAAPIQDEATVDARRAQVGLPSMKEYRRRVLSAIAEIRAQPSR